MVTLPAKRTSQATFTLLFWVAFGEVVDWFFEDDERIG